MKTALEIKAFVEKSILAASENREYYRLLYKTSEHTKDLQKEMTHLGYEIAFKWVLQFINADDSHSDKV